ncbi:MAG: VCBS repeat-containing protein, partial [Verrucomicrobiota bacterium]
LALRNTSAFSMGVDAADLDRDGQVDFLVLDMLSRDHRLRNLQVAGLPPSYAVPGVYDDRPQFSHNTLFRGRGDGTFAEIGRLAGVSASEWSWTPVFLDVDLDGLEDLLISNGHEMDMMDIDVSDRADALKAGKRLSPREQLEMRRMFRRFNPPNVAFRNEGDFRFREVTAGWGFGVAEVANGMAAADLDGDGDLDLAANNLNAAPTLYRNEATAPRVGVRLRGPGANTRGLGARLRVTGGPRPQSQEMVGGGRYLSGDEALRVFAAGAADELSVEVTWPDGRRTLAGGVRPGTVVTVAYTNTAPAVPPPVPGAGLFAEASARLGHRHVENPYDDWARQPLLPRNLAFPGPGVAWGDFDEDGWFDLAIGAGQGGTLAVFRNDRRGGFVALTHAALARPLPRDTAGVLLQRGFLFAASSHYEDGATNGGALRLVDLGRGAGGEALLGQALSGGPLVAADVDHDGSLEFLVGGGARPGAYPEASPSLLVQTAGGRLAVRQRLEGLPPVAGAVFADLDGDGWADLVVTGDWAPPVFLRNQQGRLVPWDPPVRGPGGRAGWGTFSGRWQGVAAGDFNEDGRMDLVAGNWGLNSFLAPAPGDPPWRCRWGDLDGNGTVEVVESRPGPDGREWPVRKYGTWVAAWPALRDRLASHGAFGESPLPGVVGAELPRLPLRTAGWWAATLFLNLPGGFEARTLPREAQETPSLAPVVADFDGDGHEDLFLGQNFFPVHPEEARQDAGRGLLLRGDGQGGFQPLPAAASGIEVPGEARGAAAADYDQDGRVDLVVGQNGAETRLWHNRGAAPGFRLRLKGGPGNPAAVGARVRWSRAGQGVGPAREIQAGSGYLGVDAPEWVAGRPPGTTHLEVRWPGGPEIRAEVAPEATAAEIAPPSP